VNAKSIEDVKFGLAFNKHVHSSVFFLQVARVAKNDVSPLTVSWALKSGRVLFASLNTIKGLRARCSPPLEENPAAFRKALTQKLPDGLPSWREQYLNITKDPAGSCEDMDFDECYSWGFITLVGPRRAACVKTNRLSASTTTGATPCSAVVRTARTLR
jgi:hypothetical protein